MTPVFADNVRVTVDRLDWRSLRLDLLPLFDSMGMQTDLDSPENEAGRWRLASGGVVDVKRWGSVVSVEASGQFLAHLRCQSLLNTYLATLGVFPHKVTRLDASVDVPVDAPPVLARVVRRARTGKGVQLTRKRVLPTHVGTWLSPCADGRLSGTAYFGSKTAPVRLCLYDKQKERVDHGELGASPCLRYELRIRNGLPTLRDASKPASLFWHHMSGVLRRPAGVPDWLPAVDPFRPERVELDLHERMQRRVFNSSDLAALCRLARSIPNGRALLYKEIDCVYFSPKRVAA